MTFPEVLNLNHLIEEYSSSPDREAESTTDSCMNGPDKDDDGKSVQTILAITWQNQQNGLCTQRRPGHPPSWSVLAVRMKKHWAFNYL